mgnify:CR=1 FL=1
MIFYVLAGLAAGICAGLYFPVYIPPEYGKMLSVALMAALDTAFGGIRSSMEGSYDNTVFITGFFTNAVLAAFLCYVGMILGIDLYLVGILNFWDAHFPKSGGDQTSVFEKNEKNFYKKQEKRLLMLNVKCQWF